MVGPWGGTPGKSVRVAAPPVSQAGYYQAGDTNVTLKSTAMKRSTPSCNPKNWTRVIPGLSRTKKQKMGLAKSANPFISLVGRRGLEPQT